MPEPRSTGLSGLDAQHDFLRARRRATIAKLIARLRGEPDDVALVLPYEEVIEALGFASEHSLGLQVVAARTDRRLGRPRARLRPALPSHLRALAGALGADRRRARRGESFPPVDLVKVGQLYFVRDGHHRVSVARALGRTDIDAYVTEVTTRIDADTAIRLSDLPLKSHERVFFERVPLPIPARGEIELTDPHDYDELAEAVEAWGFRAMQSQGEPLDRKHTAELWLETEYRPVVAMLREAGLVEGGTDTEAYMNIAAERYRLLRTHEWNEDVLRRVLEGKGRRRRLRG